MTDNDAVSEPDWVEHAIWWHVYPLGFVGAEPPPTTDPGSPTGFAA